MVIKFNIKNQKIICDKTIVVEKSKNYLTGKFDFQTPDWNGCEKTAYFKNLSTGAEDSRLLVDNECNIPTSVTNSTGYVEVSVHGVKDDTVITSGVCEFLATRTMSNENNIPNEDLTLYEQLLSKIGNKVPKNGWQPDKYLGTDENGNVVEKEAPEGTGGNPQKGEDGGYYTPSVTQTSEDTVNFAFSPSKNDMNAVSPVSVKLPRGKDGVDGTNGTNGKDGKDGVGIKSVEQTTTSTEDGGENVVTVTLTNGQKSTFTVRNGSQGNPGTGGGGDIDLSGYATKEEVNELSQEIVDLNDDISELKNLSVYNNFNLYSNKYIDYRYGTENLYGSDLLSITDFILIKDHCTMLGIVGINYAEDNVAGIAFYSADKEYLGGEKLYNIPNKIAIPNNAIFLRVTVPKDCIGSYGIAFIDSVEEFNAHNKSVNDNIHVLTGNINKTSEKVNAITKTVTVYSENINDEVYELNRFSASGLPFSDNSAFRTKNYIPVIGGKEIIIYCPATNFIRIVQYDAEKNIIVAPTQINTRPTFWDSKYTLNDNTKFIKFDTYGSVIGNNMDDAEISIFYSDNYPNKYVPYSAPQNITTIKKENTVSDIVSKIIKGKINIKLIGDSITHGVCGTGFAQDGVFIGNFFDNDYYRNPNGYCWANLFKEYIESKFGCTVANNAVLGTSFIDLDNNFDTFVSDEDDVIICAYGTNNRESLADITAHVKSCIEKIREKGIDVIFLTPIPASVADELTHTAHIEDICNAIKSVFISENVPYVDVNQAMLDYCDYRMVSIDSLLADGLHPNDNGYEVMFKSICKGLGITRKVDGATW